MKRTTAVGALLAVLLIGLGLWFASRDDDGPAPAPHTTRADIPPRPADAFRLTVRSVYDGDTIRAQADVANDVVTTTDSIRIRLIGIDTPERTPEPECWADEARSHLEGLLPQDATVWAAPDRELHDRYGRALLYLWTDDGVFVNHALVAAGDAEALRIAPNDAHYPLLRDAEASARAAGSGQWGACD